MVERKDVLSRCWVSVDPGIQGTGIVVWVGDRPVDIQTIVPHKELDWLGKAIEIAQKYSGVIEQNTGIEIAVIEEPFSSVRSERTLASTSSGSVVKLSIMTGMLIDCSLASDTESISTEVHLVSPKKWKGQLTKEMVRSRVYKWAGKSNINIPDKLSEHAVDALGLGLSVLGIL